jgi:excisionase family DNA binding protein
MNEYFVRILDACSRLGVGRTKLYEIINRGDLTVTKIDGRTLVIGSSLDRFIAKTIAGARAA